MKKIIILMLITVLCFSFSICAFAKEEPSGDTKEATTQKAETKKTPEKEEPKVAEVVETTQDGSTPRLMVTDFNVEGGSIKPNEITKVTVTLKNYSKTKSLRNVKLTLSDDSGDIKPVGTGNKYVDYIGTDTSYKWEFELTASATAVIGEHNLIISSVYEDRYYNSYTESDAIRINVEQTVGLDFSGVTLPKNAYTDDTVTMDIALLNTGKSNIRNCKIDFDIKGLESGGTTYIGEIEAGGQKTANVNLRTGNKTGDFEGTVTFTYEDEFGRTYEKKANVSTKLKEKPKDVEETEEETSKYPLWWAFCLMGFVLGGGIGSAIPIIIYKNKERKIDEMRL